MDKRLEEIISAMNHFGFGCCMEVTNGICRENRGEKRKKAERAKDFFKPKTDEKTVVVNGLAFILNREGVDISSRLNYIMELPEYEPVALRRACEKALKTEILSRRNNEFLRTMIEMGDQEYNIPLSMLLSSNKRTYDVFLRNFFPNFSYNRYQENIQSIKGLVLELFMYNLFETCIPGDKSLYYRVEFPLRKKDQNKGEIDLVVACSQKDFSDALKEMKKFYDITYTRNKRWYGGKRKKTPYVRQRHIQPISSA